jgi:hypothetical protein
VIVLAVASAVGFAAATLDFANDPGPAKTVAEEVSAESSEPSPSGNPVIGGWEIVGEQTVSGGRVGFTSIFYVINRDGETRIPDNLEVVARFRDVPGRLRATCTSADVTMDGARPHNSPVSPGESVFVACEDTTTPSPLPIVDLQSVRIVAVPCESSGRRAGSDAL